MSTRRRSSGPLLSTSNGSLSVIEAKARPPNEGEWGPSSHTSSYNSRDVWLIIGARSLRQAGVGLVGVILSSQLKSLDLSMRQRGIVLTASLSGTTICLLAIPMLLSAKAPVILGKGQLLMLFTILSGLCSLILPYCQSFTYVLVVVCVGSLGLPPTVAAQIPIEHSILAACASPMPESESTSVASTNRPESPNELSIIFGRYNAAGTLAISLGSLAAALPLSLHYRWNLVAFFMWSAAGLYSLLSPSASGSTGANPVSNQLENNQNSSPDANKTETPLPSSYYLPKAVLIFAGLQGIDSFAGSMILQTLVSDFLHTHYRIEEKILGPVFSVFFLLSATSVLLAPYVASKIGLINTMVFTHLPTNMMICALPFCGSPSWALALWVARACLCSMDVPVRESFMMTVLGQSRTTTKSTNMRHTSGRSDKETEELRVRTSSTITIVRSIAAIFGPVVATHMADRFSPAAPFVVSGTIKIIYDLALLASFPGREGGVKAKGKVAS